MPVLQMTESQVREMVAALRVMRQATAIIVSTTKFREELIEGIAV